VGAGSMRACPVRWGVRWKGSVGQKAWLRMYIYVCSGEAAECVWCPWIAFWRDWSGLEVCVDLDRDRSTGYVHSKGP
jgi:hypothetical protein